MPNLHGAGSKLWSSEVLAPISSTAVLPLRVLLVEDESILRWAVAETLTEAGHRVLEAPDAATALRAVSQTPEKLDVVLLDLRLPDSDDLSLVERIRQHAPSSAIVMMTAYGTPEMTEAAKDLGVHSVIAKPFDLRRVEEIIVEAAISSSLSEDRRRPEYPPGQFRVER